jgi:hypothetical protein
VSKEWAEKLVHDINEHMREQDVKEAEARIGFPPCHRSCPVGDFA